MSRCLALLVSAWLFVWPAHAQDMFLLRDAAQAGDTDAAFEYGYALTFPPSGSADYETGRYWLERAATAGSADAAYTLGLVYSEGLGVRPDLGEARQFFEQSWRTGHLAGGFALAEILIFVFEADARDALPILDRLETHPELAAQASLLRAEALIFGPEALFDAAGAVSAAQRALDRDDQLGAAYYILGVNAVEGLSGTPNASAARSFWQRGAERGDMSAMLALGEAWRDGVGGETDLVEALALFYAAAANGHPDAENAASTIQSRLGVEQRTQAEQRADRWLQNP